MTGKKTCLLVDDSEISLLVATEQLQEYGWTVTARSQGIGTVAACLTLRPKCLVVDENMVSLRGSATIDILRRARPPVMTILVLHSARPNHELAALARGCGADAWVRKGDHLGEALERYA